MTRFLPKSTLLAIAACLVAVIAVNIWQRKSNAETREEITKLQQLNQETPRESATTRTATESPALIAEAMEKLQVLSSGGKSIEDDLEPMIKVRTVLYELDGAARLKLAEQIIGQSGINPMIKQMAQLAAAEHDPVRVLGMIDTNGGEFMELIRPYVFAELVKHAPETAWQELATAVEEEKMTDERAVGIREFLKTDIPRALTLLQLDEKELKKKDALAMIFAAALESDAAPQIWRAAQAEQNDRTRELLLEGLIVAEQLQRGVSGLRIALSEWSLEERRKILGDLDENIVKAETGEVIDWMMSDLPEPEREQALSTAVEQWTKRDFYAVGRWLDDQEPSAMRDSAIQSFVTKVSGLDHEAAVAWAKEISDPPMRETLLQSLNGSKP